MGHSEAVHASRYLIEERAEHKLAHLLRQRDLDEGRNPEQRTVGAPAIPAAEAIPALPAGVTPELIELARKLQAAGLG
jgi:hypothetical protein